jgi:hypothetical protein
MPQSEFEPVNKGKTRQRKLGSYIWYNYITRISQKVKGVLKKSTFIVNIQKRNILLYNLTTTH